jgi:rod shape determining protein RodA
MAGITRTSVGIGTRRVRETRAQLDVAPVRHFDYWLVGAVIAISVIGLVMIWSTTRHRVAGDELYFVKRQALFLGLGIVAMVAVIAIDYRRLRDHALFAYFATIALLIAVLAPVGSNIKGHQAWFQLPGGFTLQPSELAKFGLIVALAAYCNQYRGELDAWRLTTIIGWAAVPIGLVVVQPDLGTVLVLAVIMVGLLTVAGITSRQLVVLVLLASTGVFAAVNLGVLKDYQLERFSTFVDPESGTKQGSAYNQEQSKQAIAHGRITGEGLGNGSQTQGGFVPEQHTDFIFTSVGEELGFLGAVVLLALFAIVMWRTWRTARLSRDFFGTLVCVGVLAMLAFQTFENIGMTVGIMPIAGIPLPFMSYGGSSLITSFACVGLVVNVSMRRFT